jgi:hypothetical protein
LLLAGVWGSNPDEGNIFHSCPYWCWGPHSLLNNGYWGLILGGKVSQVVALTTYPYLLPTLKKQYSDTCVTLWAFMTCSRVNVTITSFINE